VLGIENWVLRIECWVLSIEFLESANRCEDFSNTAGWCHATLFAVGTFWLNPWPHTVILILEAWILSLILEPWTLFLNLEPCAVRLHPLLCTSYQQAIVIVYCLSKSEYFSSQFNIISFLSLRSSNDSSDTILLSIASLIRPLMGTCWSCNAILGFFPGVVFLDHIMPFSYSVTNGIPLIIAWLNSCSFCPLSTTPPLHAKHLSGHGILRWNRVRMYWT